VKEQAQLLRHGDTGLLKVAGSPQHIESVLSGFLHNYAKRYPKVEVRLSEGTGSEILTLLKRGEIHPGQNLLHAVKLDERHFGSHLLGSVELPTPAPRHICWAVGRGVWEWDIAGSAFKRRPGC